MSLPANTQTLIGESTLATLKGTTTTVKYKIELERKTILTRGGYYRVKVYAKQDDESFDLGWVSMVYNLTVTLHTESAPLPNYHTVQFENNGDSSQTSFMLPYGEWVELPRYQSDSNIIYLPESSESYFGKFDFSGAISYYENAETLTNFSFVNTNVTPIVTFPPMPNIKNPSAVSPYNSAVDVSVPTTFSFQFQGEKLTGYRIVVTNQETNQTVYEGGIVNISETPRYNGDIITNTIDLGAQSAENGMQLNWKVIMYGDSNPDNNSLGFESLPYYFETYSNPQIDLSFNNSSLSLDNYTLDKKSLAVSGIYSQAQGVPLKYYKITLRSDGQVITDTDKIFSANINWEYDGFIGGNIYEFELTVVSQKNQIITRSILIDCEYTPSYSSENRGLISLDEDEMRVGIEWGKNTVAAPSYFPEAADYVESILQPETETENRNISLSLTQDLIYNNMSNQPYQISGGLFGFGCRLTINNDLSKLCEVATSENLWQVELENKKIYVSNQPKGDFNKIKTEELKLFGAENFALNTDTTTSASTFYRWYDDEEHTWNTEPSYYWRVDTPVSNETTIQIIITADNDTPTFEVKDVTPQGVSLEGSGVSTTEYQTSPYKPNNSYIKFFKGSDIHPLIVDGFVLNNNGFTASEKTDLDSLEYSWGDFSAPYMLSNFTRSAVSSSAESVEQNILGYKIYRQKNNSSYSELVGNYPITELEDKVSYYFDDNGEKRYKVYDYSCGNNALYRYFIYPYNSEKFETPYSCSTFDGKEFIMPEWTSYSLIPVTLGQDGKYELKSGYNDSTAYYWTFYANLEEGNITLNQDKEYFTTFAPTPKVSVGYLNYFTGSLKCLLGNILMNGEYNEDLQTLDKWNTFVSQHPVCLFRNPKGDVLIVSINPNTSKTYMNEIANRYVRNSNFLASDVGTHITSRPTEIQFDYTEVSKNTFDSLISKL